ncbi:MAG TPA: hypothetical protein VLH56_17265 [Dissulfurispiraceae bacterium]|nr:hypothetical protein [Dissulfurispiraceae bacterium]
MKKFKILALALALIAVFIAAPAQAALQDMWAAVYKWDGGMNADGTKKLTKVSTGITYRVMAIDTATAETLYYYNGSTALTNPVSTTNFAATTVGNGLVRFRVDPTDATNDRYVDLIVTDTAGGYSVFVENFDKYTHTIVIDARPNMVHQGTIWFGASSTAEQNTGITFAPNTFIHDVRVEVVTAASAITVDVGLLSTDTAGDADGFRAGLLMTNTGYVADTGVITAGTTIDWTAASTYGALLYKSIAGSDAVAAGGGRSYLGHVVSGTNSGKLTYSLYSTSGAGFIHYWFNRIR